MLCLRKSNLRTFLHEIVLFRRPPVVYDEGAGVAAGGDDGGGEGGQYQALRDLCGLRDFPPVFPHMSGL